MSAFEDRLNEYLETLADTESEKAMARTLLREVVDLAAFPADLLHHYVTLSPPLYNAGTRRFEFQRTPSVTLLVDDLTCGAAADTLITAATALDPIGGLPKDNISWRVLGGFISTSVASMVDIKDGAGGRAFFHGAVPANLFSPFALPGNGIALKVSAARPIAVNHEVGGIVDLLLFLSEEDDTQARGAV